MRYLLIALAVLPAACRSSGPLQPASPGAPFPLVPAIMVQKGNGYVAHVHRPQHQSKGQRAPAVMLIGGSGGGIGWQDYMAERLAQRGFVAMAVAYFAFDSLPPELDRIPIEAFDNALGWLSKQSYVDSKRIGIGAVSKGAEAALLVASVHPDVRAVAVFSPSGIVFQSVTRDFHASSSWTRGGVEIPFVHYGNAPRGSALVEYYRAGLKEADAATLDAATIRAERINAPILLLSGRNDTLWGSGDLADMIAARLKALSFAPGFENIVYPNAGHLISSIRTDDVTYRGGTKEGNDAAQVDGQRRFLEFFQRQLLAVSYKL